MRILFLVAMIGTGLSISARIGCSQELTPARRAELDEGFQNFYRNYRRNQQRLEILLNNRSLIPLVQRLAEDWSRFPAVGVSDSQRQQIEEILFEKKRRERAVAKKFPGDTREARINRQFERHSIQDQTRPKLAAVFLEHQLYQLKKCDLQTLGLPKVVVDSMLAKELKLTEAQKERIRKRSDQLAEKILEFVQESRQEAHDAIFDNLTPKQREKLESMFGKDEFDSFIQSMDIEQIFRHYQFSTDDGKREFGATGTRLRSIRIDRNKGMTR